MFAKIKRQKHNILKLPVNILIPPQKNKSLFLSPESFINKWAIIGYFPLHKEDIRPETIHKIFIKNEPYLYELPENIKLIHYLVSDDKKFPGQINSGELMRNKLIGKTEYGVIYAVTEILAPFDMNNITMCTGSDDYIKIWINGELVHTYNRDTRQADWDQDVVNNIRLKKGKNFIVLKQLSFNSKFRFYFRFMTGNGVPIRTKSGINSSKKIKKYKKN